MQEQEFYWTTQDGLKIFSRLWRPNSKPRALICLVHGLGEHCGRYEKLVRFLTDEGFALFAFDQRGCGKSAGRRGHTQNYDVLLDDIQQFLIEGQKLLAGYPVFLYGHSLGGNLVLNYCLRRKLEVAGVIVTSPWLRLPFDLSLIKAAFGELMDKIWPTFSQANGLSAEALSHDPEVVESYIHDSLVHNRITARLFVQSQKAGVWALEHAGEFSLPLLLMHGTADGITSSEASQEFYEKTDGDCTLRLWEGYYHELHNEFNNQAVFEVLKAWLRVHLK